MGRFRHEHEHFKMANGIGQAWILQDSSGGRRRCLRRCDLQEKRRCSDQLRGSPGDQHMENGLADQSNIDLPMKYYQKTRIWGIAQWGLAIRLRLQRNCESWLE